MCADRVHPPEIFMRVLAYVALWMIACGVFALLWYIFDIYLHRHVWAPTDYIRWAAVEWSTLFALGPLAYWLSALKPIEPPRRLRNFCFHLVMSVGFTVLAVMAATFLSLFVEPGEPEIRPQIDEFVSKHGEAGFLAYWVLVLTRQAVWLHREKVRRELQASHLQTQLAQSHLQLLKMQLHPHFLFNALHTAATLSREDAAATEDMLLRLAELLRTYLDDDRQEITLQEELDLIELYLGIQCVRFKDRLTARVDVAPELMQYAVPSLILQPIVENAIGHGIGKHIGDDCVEISCSSVAGYLCIDVRNRNSTVAGTSEDPFRRGIGLSNSRLRLAELYGSEGRILLEALSPRGAVCSIRVPLKHLAAIPAAERRRVG